MKVKDYSELIAWQKAMDLVGKVMRPVGSSRKRNFMRLRASCPNSTTVYCPLRTVHSYAGPLSEGTNSPVWEVLRSGGASKS
jgi:hypothetical protein